MEKKKKWDVVKEVHFKLTKVHGKINMVGVAITVTVQGLDLTGSRPLSPVTV